jgi:transcriptional regulator with XRE-family HTH domain
MPNNSSKKEYPHLGNNIRIARLMRNYTQEFMASQLNISKSRYSQIEQEEHINTSYLFKIIEVLKIDLATFLSVDFSDKLASIITSPRSRDK